MPDRKVLVIVAGGTGGHLYPGIAVARALKTDTAGGRTPVEWDIVFMVRKGDRGKEILEREGFRVAEICGQGFPRRLSWKMITFPFVLLAGFVQSWFVLIRLRPTVMLGMGGYLSFPALIAGRLQGRRTMIHEQNVLPGVSNRWLGRWVHSIAVSFEGSRPYFQSKKVWVSGLPVRPEFGTVSAVEGRKRLELEENRLTFLIFGGSQGAHRLNEAVVGTWSYLSDQRAAFQVLHITGERNYSSMVAAYRGVPVDAKVLPYCHEMAAALAAADVVVCRAGASTLAELLVSRKPALFVPFPFASENHQFYNAETMVNAGGAELIEDADLSSVKLAARFRIYLRDPQHLDQMKKRLADNPAAAWHTSAAQRLAESIQKMA